MAMTSNIGVTISASQTAALDLVSKVANLLKTYNIALDTGTGLGQADVCFSDTRTTAGTDSLDLAGGGLLDNVGAVFAPARVKVVFVFAAVANTTNVLFRRPAGATGVPIFSAVADEIPIHPGGMALIGSTSAAGYPVTAGTGDIIEVAAASGTVTYDIIIIGASA
jgi:hypothetical protein